MIYFLYGDDDWQIDQAVNQLKKRFVREHSELAVSTIDVTAVDVSAMARQLLMTSLFSDTELILLKGVTAKKEAWDTLGDIADQIPNTKIVVATHIKAIASVTAPTNTVTFRKLKSLGSTMKKFDSKSAPNPSLWLQKEAKRRQITITPPAIDRLVSYSIGENNALARLSLELDKLTLLNNHITDEMVEAYVEPSPHANAFIIFSDALKGKATISDSIHQLADSGEDPFRFFGLMVSQVMALAAAQAGAKGVNEFQLGLAKKLLRELGWGTPRHILAVIDVMSDLDYQLKTSKPEEIWTRIEIALGKLG